MGDRGGKGGGAEVSRETPACVQHPAADDVADAPAAAVAAVVLYIYPVCYSCVVPEVTGLLLCCRAMRATSSMTTAR